MIVKQIVDEDFVNYKKPSMFIAFPRCTFKCEKESGVRCCQNSDLAKAKGIIVTEDEVVARYIGNKITRAIVIGGLEPMDDWIVLSSLIEKIRYATQDDIVIYTGYTEDEIAWLFDIINCKNFSNIIVKFGRYVPGHKKHYDEVLGVYLASDNQYAKRIS